MSVIARTNVIAGAQDDTYQVDPYGDDDAGVQTAEVVLNAAAMQAINSSPQELVAAPADGASIAIVSVRVQKATNAYTGNYVLAFRYGTGANVAQVAAATLTGAGATDAYADPVAPSTPVPPADMALNAFAAGNYGGNGGDVTITVKYVLVKDE